MPQLDFLAYSHQWIWLFVVLTGLTHLFSVFIIPQSQSIVACRIQSGLAASKPKKNPSVGRIDF